MNMNRWSLDPQKIRWLFRQKMRVEKGLCVMPIINFTLLTISASDRIQRACEIKTTNLVLCLVPFVIGIVWLVGYILYLPSVQQAEDAEISNCIPWRRELTEIRKNQ
jgi:hypothetical protein